MARTSRRRCGRRPAPASAVWSPTGWPRVVERALTARRPRARYVVGADARAMILAQAVLPTRVFDRLMRRAMGFSRRRVANLYFLD